MNCPVDGAELRMADRSGVEIDYCPKSFLKDLLEFD